MADIYFANVSAGANDGSSCANAFAYNDVTNGWNTSGKQVAGNVLHVCGTITGGTNSTILTATNSGTSGNPITLKWETGAILQAPFFQGSGTTPTCGLTVNGKSFWTFDGGTNGIIQNTANGTGLANQSDTCFINMQGGSNNTVKNLTLANAYVHQIMQTGVTATGTGTTATLTCAIANCGLAVGESGITVSDPGGSSAFDGTNITITGVSGNTASYASAATGSGSNLTLSDTKGGNSYGIIYGGGSNLAITNNVFHDIRWQTFGIYASAGLSTWTLTGNEFYNGDHGAGGGSNANSATLDNFLVQFNTFHDFQNWRALCGTDSSNPNFCFHLDYYHIWAGGGANTSARMTNVVIDKNYFYGDAGGGTAYINLESDQSRSSYYDGCVVSNNVLVASNAADIPASGYISSGGQNEKFVNNTVIGSSSSQGVSNAGVFIGSAGLNETIENNIFELVGYGINTNQAANNWTTIDFNYYYKHNGQMNYSGGGGIVSFATWQAVTGTPDTHSTSSGTVAPQIQTVIPFAPTGANVQGAGTNLTSLCSTHAQICTGIGFSGGKPVAGTARPSSGSWDLGAVQTAASGTGGLLSPPGNFTIVLS